MLISSSDEKAAIEKLIAETPIRPTYRLVDWAKITQKQMVEGDKGLSDRLAIWIDMNEAKGRMVTTRQDFTEACLVYEAWETTVVSANS